MRIILQLHFLNAMASLQNPHRVLAIFLWTNRTKAFWAQYTLSRPRLLGVTGWAELRTGCLWNQPVYLYPDSEFGWPELVSQRSKFLFSFLEKKGSGGGSKLAQNVASWWFLRRFKRIWINRHLSVTPYRCITALQIFAMHPLIWQADAAEARQAGRKHPGRTVQNCKFLWFSCVNHQLCLRPWPLLVPAGARRPQLSSIQGSVRSSTLDDTLSLTDSHTFMATLSKNSARVQFNPKFPKSATVPVTSNVCGLCMER